MADNALINAAIVDDDPGAVFLLEEALGKFGNVKVISTAGSLMDALSEIEEKRPDIVFLDIELGDGSGLDILDRINGADGCNAKIIFYTSYRRYLIQALRMQAFDFLLKPIDFRELDLILKRYMNCAKTDKVDTFLGGKSRILDTLKGSRCLAITTVTNDRIIVSPSDIVYFKYDSDRKLWDVVLSDMRHFMLKRTTNAETILGFGNDFVKTHKTFIVNLTYLSMISGNECILLPPFDKIRDIKISKNYRKELLDRFYDI